MGEVIFFIIFGILMVGSWLLMKGPGRLFWTILFGVIASLVGIAEGVAYIMTQHTISQLFWIFSESSPGLAWTSLGLVTVGWLMLILHLSAKLWGKKE